MSKNIQYTNKLFGNIEIHHSQVFYQCKNIFAMTNLKLDTNIKLINLDHILKDMF